MEFDDVFPLKPSFLADFEFPSAEARRGVFEHSGERLWSLGARASQGVSRGPRRHEIWPNYNDVATEAWKNG